MSEPLEKYFDEQHPRPDLFSGETSSACWRGYVGTWEIKDDSLYLKSLGRDGFEKVGGEFRVVRENVPLTTIFPEATASVRANWFSGVIRVGRGEILRYVHMSFGSITEEDLYLTIKAGRVVAKRLINNKDVGATRSDADMEWVALAEQPVPDSGDWLDGRLISNEKRREEFKTRGIFFPARKEQPAELSIPETPTTPAVPYILEAVPATDIPGGSHVEVTLEADAEAQWDRLRVKSIRQLEPGESIHHKDFRKSEQKANVSKELPLEGVR